MGSPTNPVLFSTVPMHAHRCEACAAKGEEVTWIHPETDFRQIAAHKCPKCGTVNWKVSKKDSDKLPPPLPRNEKKFDMETVLGYAIFFVAVAAIVYIVYLVYKDKKNVASLPSTGIA